VARVDPSAFQGGHLLGERCLLDALCHLELLLYALSFDPRLLQRLSPHLKSSLTEFLEDL
jgi:hypothetical protein